MSTVDSNFYPLNEVWNSKARIVFVFTSAVLSRRIICLAYHLKLVYPDYQFVLTNPTFDDFVGQDIAIMYNHEVYRCSAELLVNESLDGAFLISHQLDTPSTINEVTFANTTFKRFLELYEQRIEEYNSEHRPGISISPTYMINGLYDAVWAWAIVLDELISNNEGLIFKYGNQTLANLILDRFYSLDFQGISGHIRFDSKGGYVRRANLYQVLNNEVIHVAYSNGTHMVVEIEDIHTISGMVGFLTLPHSGIVGFFLTIQSIGLVVVVMLHCLTLIRCNTKIVKASSPKLVQPAYFGTYAFVLTMMLYVSFFSGKVHKPTLQKYWGDITPKMGALHFTSQSLQWSEAPKE